MRRWKIAIGIGGLALASLIWAAIPAGTTSRVAAADKSTPAAGSTDAAPAKPDRGWIGVMLEANDSGQTVVGKVFPAGPAAFAGLRAGDVIVAVNGQATASPEAAAQAIEAVAPGSDVKVTVKRESREEVLTARVGSLREFHGRYVAEMFRRDPRDPRYGEMHGVSEADMSVELVRRTFEQNRRLEAALRDVQSELQSLRKEVQALKK